MKTLRRHRYTLHVALVVFVFLVLLATSLLVGCVYYALFHLGILAPATAWRLPVPILGLLLASVLIATGLAALLGKEPFRALEELIRATDEVAAGHFDVQVEPKGAHEVRRLAQSFNAMARELRNIETLRDDFVTNVSHEFKTPVVSIMGFAKLLGAESTTEAEKREYIDIIIAESERLVRLSGNVLLLSKLENQEIPDLPATFSLDEQIRRAVLLLEGEWGKKGLELDISLHPVTYTGYEGLLQQVWLNLIGNAVKFTGPGGIISLSMRCREAEIEVVVSDTGIGMDEETQRHLFDKFYQGDRSRGTPGNGLGLCLVRRVMERSGGRITVESAPEAGSTFRVFLPRGRESL